MADQTTHPFGLSPMDILVVDDNIDAAESMALLLRSVGHTVLTAGSGQEALDSVGSFRPKVVLSDLAMPRMNGLALVQELRKVTENVVIILQTGHPPEDLLSRARDAGADAIVSKPTDFEELLQLIRDQLNRNSAPAKRSES